jgi:hypothetical protein
VPSNDDPSPINSSTAPGIKCGNSNTVADIAKKM